MSRFKAFKSYVLSIFLIVITNQSSAQINCIKVLDFKISNRLERMCIANIGNTLISEKCFTDNNCKILIALEYAKKIKLEKNVFRGKNPGQHICLQLGLITVVGTYKKNIQNCFCKATDNTYIDCLALAKR